MVIISARQQTKIYITKIWHYTSKCAGLLSDRKDHKYWKIRKAKCSMLGEFLLWSYSECRFNAVAAWYRKKGGKLVNFFITDPFDKRVHWKHWLSVSGFRWIKPACTSQPLHHSDA